MYVVVVVVEAAMVMDDVEAVVERMVEPLVELVVEPE